MAQTNTKRLKFETPIGRLPVLQFMQPAELQIDPQYQRSIEGRQSQSLIAKIAQGWNWDLCQPLVIARRSEEGLFVIDGQHRLEAARLRGDITQLPCVVVDYAGAAEEAASFVHLNQQRRPLTTLDLFKAALASGDEEAQAIMAALTEAGLGLTNSNNIDRWKPGQVQIIGGIQRLWRREGQEVVSKALDLLAEAYRGEIMRFAGTIWPGLVAVCAEEMRSGKSFAPDRFAQLASALNELGQEEFRKLVLARCALNPDIGRSIVAIRIVQELHDPERFSKRSGMGSAPMAPLVFKTDQPVAAGGDGKAWCDQCDMRVTQTEAEGCKSRHCSLRKLG